MSLGVLDELGQSVLPEVFESLTGAGVVETMNILTAVGTTDSGGGYVYATATSDFRDIPVSVLPKGGGYRATVGDRPVSGQQYVLTFATHIDGERIDLDPQVHRLKVLARGNEPDKTFRILAAQDTGGVTHEVICERENVE